MIPRVPRGFVFLLAGVLAASSCRSTGSDTAPQDQEKKPPLTSKDLHELIERILYLEGIPNLQRLGAVKVGEEPIEMHKLDLTLETEAAARLNKAIALCLDRKDAGTRELLEHLLIAEEDSVEWLEAQLVIVKDIGRERYLSEQLRS